MPRGYTLTPSARSVSFMMDCSAENAVIERHRANAQAFVRYALLGAMFWSGSMSLDSGGSNITFAFNYGALASATSLTSSLTGTVGVMPVTGVIEPAGTLTLANVEGAPVNISANTWYYAYASNDGSGAFVWELSTTAPDASLLFKTGTTSQRYVGCFTTVTGGVPIPFVAKKSGGRGLYRYNLSGIDVLSGAADRCEVLTAGNATAWTSVNLTRYVPPHARIAHLRVSVTSTDASSRYFRLRTLGETLGYETFAIQGTASQSYATFDITINVSSGQIIEYLVENANVNVTLTVLGFEE